MTRVLLLTLTLFLAASPLSAQLAHDTAVSLPRYGEAAGTQRNPVVAAGDNHFLVAWLDDRAPEWAIYGTRVTPSGEVLDPTGIRIEPPVNHGYPGGTSLVAALRVERAYVVVYHFLSPSIKSQTAIVRIDDDGKVLAQRIVDEEVVSAASDGSTIVLAGRYYLTVLDPELRPISQQLLAPVGLWLVAVASNGSRYLLASQTHPENATQLRVLDRAGRTISTVVSTVWPGGLIASDGQNYLAISSSWYEPEARSVSAAGEPGPSVKLPAARYSDLIWTGETFVAFGKLTSGSEAIAVRLSRQGAVLGHSTLASSSWQTLRLGAAWNGIDLFFAWPAPIDPQTGETELLASRIGADLTIEGAVRLSRSAIEQTAPALATGGVHDLVVWSESSGVYAARVTKEGVPLDGEGRLIARSKIGVSSPRVLFLRDEQTDGYVVVWSDGFILRGQRVDDESGATIGEAFEVASCSTSFDVQAAGSELLLAASSCTAGDPAFLQRFDGLGPLGDPLPLPRGRGSVGRPRLASNGSEWLVVWDDTAQIATHGRMTDTEVVGVRLTSSLALLDAQPVVIGAGLTDDRAPVVASDGNGFAVVWTTDYDWPKARRIGSDGGLGDVLDLRGATSQRGLADSIAWDGSQYVILLSARSTPHASVAVVRTDRSLASASPSWALLSPREEQTRTAHVVATAGRPTRAVYTRVFEHPSIGGVSRVVVRDLVWSRRRAVSR